MIITEVLSVGTELLMGQIANTDAQYISRRLPDAGAGVYYHTVVGDNGGRLSGCLRAALSRADIVITTGGLGPTQDDLTKQTIAREFDLELAEDSDSRRRIDAFFAARGRKATENNYRQALIPEGAEVLTNDHGTAPGCIIRGTGGYEGKTVIMLPGPPNELRPMFEKYVMPLYRRLAGSAMVSRFVRICGKGESEVEAILMDLIDGQTNPTFATYAKDGLVTVRVTASGNTEAEAAAAAERGAQAVSGLLGDNVYSFTDEEPEQALIRLLKEQGLTVAAAESLTGGMISQKLTSVPGASAAVCAGCVTYSDAAKHKLLGVKQETLTTYTAVSAETCREMAAGMRALSGADIAIAVTGYAGPRVSDEPVGLVYIGVACADGITVKEQHFTGSRERIRTLTAVNAIDLTRRLVQKCAPFDAV